MKRRRIPIAVADMLALHLPYGFRRVTDVALSLTAAGLLPAFTKALS